MPFATLAAVPVPTRFRELVRGAEADLPLDEACLLLAASLRDGVDVAHELARIDELALGVSVGTVDGVLDHLFRRLGYRGAVEQYDDPANSMLDLVRRRRTGIPITLSVLTMEVGRRVGARFLGIGLPGHFLIRDAADPDGFVDPFAGGTRLDKAGVEARFRAVHGPDAAFDDSYLGPTGRRAIVTRILANLSRSYAARADRRSLAVVLQHRVAVPGGRPDERRKLAGALAALGRFDVAAAELEELAASASGEEASGLQAGARRLRARLN